jgi:hypothetical protein
MAVPICRQMASMANDSSVAVLGCLNKLQSLLLDASPNFDEALMAA